MTPFAVWVNNRHVPLADRVVPMVASAGRRGMTRAEIGKAIDLERATLDALLAGLVEAGQLIVHDHNGFRVFWAVPLIPPIPGIP
jgi:hypothetical protein